MLLRVSPFGHPRINGYVLLPEAFRSWSRPSSALSAKAFALRSFLLDPLVYLYTRLPSVADLSGLVWSFLDSLNL